jgi:DNA-binding winged helix-turn-helix (wHTH) protein
MNENPVLIVREGQLSGQRWTIDSDEFIIGRGSDCNVILPERQVSRHHARITRDDNTYVLHDLGKNGTHVNGVRVQDKTRLHDGDEIQIALAVKMVFVGTDATLPLTFDLPTRERGLLVDTEQRSVTLDGTLLEPPLSLAQFRLLNLLYEAEGAVVDRDTIVDTVWPGTDGIGVTEQAIDALVRRLRDRLAELTDENIVVTVRGHGFRLEDPTER